MTETTTSARRSPSRLARNAKNKVGGLDLLKSLKDEEVAAVFFDPQYRGLLDKMGYGNEGKTREKARGSLPQMTTETIEAFVDEIARVLRPSGHLFLWLDKFGLAMGMHLQYLDIPKIEMVDLIAWNKMRPGMGRRARCVTEYLVVVQKEPKRAKGCWSDHRLNDCWAELSDRTVHPHAKPYQLTERLIRAATCIDDLVVDPCAGSYMVLDACRNARREFLGCDLVG